MTDHYQTLGVAPTASAAEIRQAYARLARERHPTERRHFPKHIELARRALRQFEKRGPHLVGTGPRSGE